MKELKQFLSALNYVADYYQDLARDTAVLYTRLKKNPFPCKVDHTAVPRKIKTHVKYLPCIHLANSSWFKLVEIDTSNIGYGGILKQVNPESNKYQSISRLESGMIHNLVILQLKKKCFYY